MLERRSFPRSAFMADVSARVCGKRLLLYVYDLSMDGCMIQTSSVEPAEGQRVALNFSKQCTAIGTVLWRKNRNLGLKFESRLASDTVELLVKAASVTAYSSVPHWKVDRSVLKVANRKVDPPRFAASLCELQGCSPE
jgi:hypothetical protein